MNIVIADFIVFIVLTYLGVSFLSLRFDNRYINLSLFIIAGSIAGFINYNGASTKKALILFIIYILYISIMFSNRFKDKFMVIIPYYCIILISEILVGLFLNLYHLVDQRTAIDSLNYNLGLLLSQILSIIISWIYVKLSHYFQTKNPLRRY